MKKAAAENKDKEPEASEQTKEKEKETKKDKPLIPNTEIDGLDDKPWQTPGADLSDYFNYG